MLDGAGHGVVLVETVGVGQGEVDVAEATDTTLVVLVPESGDAVQAMKAGLMEVADVFCVNKADKPEAPRLVRALRQALDLRAGDERPAVVSASATTGAGLDRLLDALDAHRQSLAPRWDALRAERLRRRVRRLVEARWRREFWDGGGAALADAVGALDGEAGPHALAERLLGPRDAHSPPRG